MSDRPQQDTQTAYITTEINKNIPIRLPAEMRGDERRRKEWMERRVEERRRVVRRGEERSGVEEHVGMGLTGSDPHGAV